MNKFVALCLGVVCALALLLAALGAARAQNTAQVPVPADQYVDLGAGPLDVDLNGAGPVSLALSTTQPAKALLGPLLSVNRIEKTFCGTTHVWALSLNPAGSVVSATPATCASGGAGGGTVIQGAAGASPWLVADSTLSTAIANLQAVDAANSFTYPLQVAQLGSQLSYEAFGGTSNAALTNTAGAVSIGVGAFNLLRVECWNPNTVKVYLQFFDAAASITLGATVPTKVIECPPGNGTTDGSYDHEYNGIKFVAGLRVDATTTPSGSVAPTTAVSASIGYRAGN